MGQYRNLEEFKKTMVAYHGADPAYDVDADIEKRMAARQDRTPVMEVLGRVGAEHRAQPFILASHGRRLRRACGRDARAGLHDRGVPRGHRGRASRARDWRVDHRWRAEHRARRLHERELGRHGKREGLADIICADYHTPSMLVAAAKLVDLGVCTLPEAVAKVTANPAAAFGLDDRGAHRGRPRGRPRARRHAAGTAAGA